MVPNCFGSACFTVWSFGCDLTKEKDEQLIRIYYARVSPEMDETLFQKEKKKLCKSRQEKIASCKKRIDQMRSLGAGLLLKEAVVSWGLTYEEELFCMDEKGKIWINQAGVYVSITHAGNLVAVGISDCNLGIDVEDYVGRFLLAQGVKRRASLMRKAYNQEEIKQVEALEGRKQAITCAQIWTRKEAYSKWAGCGIAMDFSSIDTQREEVFFSQIIEGDYILSGYCENAGKIDFVPVRFDFT